MAEVPVGQAQQQAINVKEAMQEEWYDLLPIEKKLITYSLGLGLALLVVFILVFLVFK